MGWMLKELERFVDTMLGAGGMHRDHPGYELVTRCGDVFRKAVLYKLGRREFTAEEGIVLREQFNAYTSIAKSWNVDSVTGEVVMRWRFPGPSMRMPEPVLWNDDVLKHCLNARGGWTFETLDDNTTNIALCWNKDMAYAIVQQVDASLARIDDAANEGQVYSVKLLMVSKFGSVLPALVQQELSEEKVEAGHLWWDSARSKFVALAEMMTSPVWTTVGEQRGDYVCSELLRMFNVHARHSRKPWGNLIRMFAPRASRVDGVNTRWLPTAVQTTFTEQDRFFWNVDNTHLIYVINMRGNPLLYKLGFVAKSPAELSDTSIGWG